MSRPVSLGALIRARRAALGLTQEALAERIDPNLRQSDISRLESDHIGLPRRQRLEAIAAALDLPLGELLSVSGWSRAGEFIAPRGGHPVPGTATAPAAAPRSHFAARQRVDAAPPPSELHDQIRVAIEQARDARAQAVQLRRRIRELLNIENGGD